MMNDPVISGKEFEEALFSVAVEASILSAGEEPPLELAPVT